MEGFGFWIFMGLFMVAVITAGSREKIEKQRTLQRLLERNEAIDEDLVNRLLGKPALSGPGGAYRVLRAIGAFVMVAAIPAGIAAAVIRVTESAPVTEAVMFGVFLSLLPFLVGLGLFIAARLCERPDQSSGKVGCEDMPSRNPARRDYGQDADANLVTTADHGDDLDRPGKKAEAGPRRRCRCRRGLLESYGDST